MGLTKAFVGVNRIFGWAAAIGGALTMAESVVRLAFGYSSLTGMAGRALTGFVLLVIGIVYIRAPLTRDDVAAKNNSGE
jgi:hypothetical protein